MASGGNNRDAEYALYKLLQMGTVAEYQSKAFSLARAAKARFTNLELWVLLRSNPTTLGEAFFRARITEGRFEDDNNQVVHHNVRFQEDPSVNDKQEVKKAYDQEMKNVKDEEGKNAAEGGRGKRVLAATAEDVTALFLEPRYFPSSILVPVLFLIEEYEIPESRYLFRHHIEDEVVFEGVGSDTSMVQHLEETTFHKSNKVEETDLTSPDMVVTEDLGQKHIYDFDETTIMLGSQGKLNEIGCFNGLVVQNISNKRDKSEKIMRGKHIKGMKLVKYVEDKTSDTKGCGGVVWQ
ncbi:hypothetical protein Tco_0651903 [Tanacetum coccineum]|uniref:Uncharacterized protein n=1 Tax=Tanacetum coccineum TaxID=301880 RepID=A0ABQ4WW30_9ASTR